MQGEGDFVWMQRAPDYDALELDGIIGAIIIALIAVMASQAAASAAVGLLGGLVFGGIWFGLFFVLGILVSAQGQILRATLDTAVNTSPFLTNEDKACVIDLT
jgi:hypothetical protein